MSNEELFLASPEARALESVPEAARLEIALRIDRSLAAFGRPLEKLKADDVHGWLFHALPEEFEPGDALAPQLAPVLLAVIDFAARTSGTKLKRLRESCEEALPELEEALEHGHSHGRAHDHGEDEPQAPYVRESPKVGRNDPCPCGSGKKFKKCHGA
jgi:hypothetical protein